jgi:hypothetical protein
VSAGVANFSCSVGQPGPGYELSATDSVYALNGTASMGVNADPSLAKSTVVVSPDPTILDINGGASFAVTVTVEDAGGNPVVGDMVSLSFDPPGELNTYPPIGAEATNSDGVSTWNDLSCNRGYCIAGTPIAVTATDETAGLVLGTADEAFVGADISTPLGDLTGWAGQTATVSLRAAPASQGVSVTFDGSVVGLSGDCATDTAGGLSQLGDTGDCTFTVPDDPNVGAKSRWSSRSGASPTTSASASSRRRRSPSTLRAASPARWSR